MPVFETLGERIGANVSVVAVDLAPGEGPALHRHTYPEVFVLREEKRTHICPAPEVRWIAPAMRRRTHATRAD